MNTRYWIGVVSRSHVLRGVEGGFAQLCHGKAAPLKRMNLGDWLIYYSPKTDMEKGEALQEFTAIGKVTDNRVYEFQMTKDFVPFRRDIAYVRCNAAAIKPLITKLTFIKDKQHWGYLFRTGHFEISKKDFELIARSMGVEIDE